MESSKKARRAAVLVELCVEDEKGVRLARDGGADRAELARDLSTGGLTPSEETFLAALRVAPPSGLRVLVRENPDSFNLTAHQVALQSQSIRRFVSLLPAGGPQVGFVVGGLQGRRINLEAARQWRRAAGHHYLVFHRAFDEIADQEEALLQLIDLGYDAVLTTGGSSGKADPAGLARLRKLGAGRITIIGSGGVREHNAAEVVVAGELTDVHFRVEDPKASDQGLAFVQRMVSLTKSI